MRIVAGSAKGRALKGPKRDSADIRPTADRVRETLFNVLGQWLDGERVLDLYAGTGALGLESLSRGAASAVLVDSGREALALCEENSRTLGFSAQVRILAMPAERAMAQLGKEQATFELIFADPPYRKRVVQDLLEAVQAGALLAPGGRLVLEHDRREDAPERAGAWERFDQRAFGDTRVSLYRFA
jgi:16S rRNA (guanine(966)-N(2))-methyltransferase RsmD